MMAHILNVPYEPFLVIMTHLEWSDVRVCSMVCRSWHQMINRERTLHNKLGSVVRFIQQEEFEKGFRFYAQNCHKTAVKKLCMDSIRFKYEPDIWQAMLPELTRLDLYWCTMRKKDLERILRRCQNLTSLSLCNVWNVGAQADKFLMDPASVVEMKKSLSNLTNLRLRLIMFDFDETTRLFQCLSKLRELDVNPFEEKNHFYNIIRSVRATLKKLWVVGEAFMFYDLYRQMAQMEGLHLTHLNVGVVRDLNNCPIVDLIRSQKSLVHFGMSIKDHPVLYNHSFELRNEWFKQICDATKHLKGLDINNFLGDSQTLYFDNHHSLEYVKFENFEFCQADGWCGLTHGASLNKLRVLDIPNFKNLQIDGTERIFRQLSNLTEIDMSLGNVYPGHMDTIFQLIIKHCSKLKVINSNLRGLTDLGLSGRNFQLLGTSRKLELLENHRLARRRIRKRDFRGQTKDFDYSGTQVDQLKCLTDLNLRACKVSDIAVLYCFQFRNLRYLNLNYCEGITDIGFKLIAKYNPQLEVLSSRKSRITNKGIKSLTKYLPRLDKLSLTNCDHFNANALTVFPGHAKYLRFLHLTRNIRANCFEAEELRDRMPRLTLVVSEESTEEAAATMRLVPRFKTQAFADLPN